MPQAVYDDSEVDAPLVDREQDSVQQTTPSESASGSLGSQEASQETNTDLYRPSDTSTGPSSGNDTKNDEEDKPKAEEEKEKSFYKSTQEKRSGFINKVKGGKKKAALVGGGAFFLIIPMILIFMFLSSLKGVHFSEVMAASAFTRFNGILQERTTQSIFDASLTEGESGISVRGKSIIDKLRLRNVDTELAKLGRDGRLGYTVEEGNLKSVKVGDGNFSLDQTSRDLGFGKDFKDLGARERLSVRAEFTRQFKEAVGTEFQLEPRYIRSRIFKTTADAVGFKFSGWRQRARDLLGKNRVEAQTDATINDINETLGNEGAVETGISEIDNLTKEMRNVEKIRKYVEKRGGTFDSAAYIENGLKSDIANASKIQEISSKVSTFVLISSLACITNQAFSHVDEIEQRNEQQLTFSGLNTLAKLDQNRSGKVESNGVQTWGNTWDGAERSPRYFYDTSNYENIMPAANSPTFVPSIKVKPSMSADFANLVAIITAPSTYVPSLQLLPQSTRDEIDKKFCDFILSPEGAVSLLLADVIVTAVSSSMTLGVSEALEQGATRVAVQIFIKELAAATKDTIIGAFSVKSLATVGAFTAYSYGISMAAGMLSGTEVTGAETGVKKYETNATGLDLVANRQIRSLHGKPISNEKAKAIDKRLALEQKKHWSTRNFATRYFDIHNPYSLIGKVSAQVPTSYSNVSLSINNIIGSIGRIIQRPASLIFNPFSSRVFADMPDNYNPYGDVQQYAFDEDEVTRMRSDPAFSVRENSDHITDQEVQDFDNSIGKCFDVSRSQTDISRDGDCSEDKLNGSGDQAKKDKILHWRVEKLDESIGEIMDTDSLR